MFQAKVLKKIETHILCSIYIFFENLAIFYIMWKFFRAEQATDDSMAQALCMVDT